MASNPPAAPPPAPAGDQQAAGAWVDPYRAYNFRLVIGDRTIGYFSRCTGLGARVQAIKYREGGSTAVVRVPGQVDYGDVTLSYGLTSNRELFDWFMSAARGDPQRKHVSILILGASNMQEVVRWDLINAWVSEWRGAVLDALENEVAIEHVTLVFESLSRTP